MNRTEQVKADEEVRTLDIQLGKLTLYQLSYVRELWKIVQRWADQSNPVDV